MDPSRLKPIERVLSKPYFDEEGAACARFLAERYVAPLSACVRLFTPPGGVPRLVRNAHGGYRLEEPAVGEVDDRWATLLPVAEGFVPRKNAVKQAAVVEALRGGDLRVAELALEFGSVAGTLKALEDKGVVRIEHRRRMRGAPGVPAASSAPEPPGAPATPTPAFAPARPQLTHGQADALDAIRAARAAGEGRVVLVDGVTGSGKTEVYL
ncbi:MAG: primosomal protein N', partial [Eggerthellaceae bacterium]|nr:primosomal protein N' [Eggerthellaceae bacterium]